MNQKEIAELAGVSRGTVDRVVNNRGNVNPEVEFRIKKIIKEMNYRPNKAGRALVGIKKPLKIGVILASKGNPFFKDVLLGINTAAHEYRDYGMEVLLREVKGYDVQEQVKLIHELQEEPISCLTLAPINDPLVAQAINEVCEKGIKVVALNQDIAGSSRTCYVGPDYRKCGQIAAGLTGMLRKDARVLIVIGSGKMLGHSQRAAGFEETAAVFYPGMKIAQIVENQDDEITSYSIVREQLERDPDISAVFFAAGGVEGGMRAVREVRDKDLTVVSVDCTEEILQDLKDGWINAAIGQHPMRQGEEVIKLFYRMFSHGENPDSENIFIPNEIYIRESFSDYSHAEEVR